ncbi:MAG: hypothetical protein JXQ82_07795 [Methanomicrobiaceae archaeon]|nr:hypothetical protein [Methanomicrobiaceae archaeon]
MTLPWEIQPKESEKAFAAFCVYRDLGPDRSLSKVSEALQKSSRWIKEWSRTHDWIVRVKAYDNHLDEVQRQEEETQLKQDIKSAAKSRRDILTKQRKILEKQTDHLLKQWENYESGKIKKPPLMSMSDWRQVTDSIVRNERLEHGEVTERTEHSGDISTSNDLSRLITEDADSAELLAELWRRRNRKGAADSGKE